MIFYRVGDDRIEIVHIIHAARDYEAILFPDG
ncbi:plasmid stabilization system [Aurantimonas sp. 22II-16-19i]|nr:plasmid stabilization system [Aurantimonas sp. 22II-16-19i]